MSRPYSSVNRFAALDSLGDGTKPHPRPVNGGVDSTILRTKANGTAKNAGKPAKNRTSTESVDSQPLMTTTVRATTTRQRKTKLVPRTNGNGNGHPVPAAAVAAAAPPIDWEIPRKSLHASIGFLVLYLYSLRPASVWPLIRTLVAVGTIIYLVDLLRFRSPGFARWYHSILGPLMRESEKTSVNGVVWYLIGVTFTLAVYPRDIAVVAIMTLSWSDTAASTIGRLVGPRSPPLPSLPWLPLAARKSLAGYLAAGIVGFLICLGFWWNGRHAAWQPHAGDAGWWFLDFQGAERGNGYGRIEVLGKPLGLWLSAVVLGLGGATVEAIDVKLDDNMTLPIGTGALMWAWLSIAKYIL